MQDTGRVSAEQRKASWLKWFAWTVCGMLRCRADGERGRMNGARRLVVGLNARQPNAWGA